MLPFVMMNSVLPMTEGVWQNRTEREAIYHFYRYLGHLMGIEDALLCADFPDLTRATWLAALNEIRLDEEGPQLAAAALDAYGDIVGGFFGKRLAPFARPVVMQYAASRTRLMLGRKYADGLGLPPLHPAIALAVPLFALTVGVELARILVPGGNRISAAVHKRSVESALRAAARNVRADLTHRREQVGRSRGATEESATARPA